MLVFAIQIFKCKFETCNLVDLLLHFFRLAQTFIKLTLHNEKTCEHTINKFQVIFDWTMVYFDSTYGHNTRLRNFIIQNNKQ